PRPKGKISSNLSVKPTVASSKDSVSSTEAAEQEMDIKLHNVAKRYRFEWIFRNISYEFESGRRYAIAGPNGAGKSTFLKILSGHLSPTEGKVVFFKNGASLEPDIVYKYLGFAAP